MTAGHVLWGKDRVIVVPGKNGDGVGADTEPFGRFSVASSNWVIHPAHADGSAAHHEFDIALICVPSTSHAPAGRFFDLVEELTQSREEGVVVCGYAARWTADTPVEGTRPPPRGPAFRRTHGPV